MPTLNDRAVSHDMSQDPFELRYAAECALPRHIEARDLGWANILPTLLDSLTGATHFLDLGSGTGVVACRVAAEGLRVTALDRSRTGVALGVAQAARLNVHGVVFRQFDLDSRDPLPVEAPVDVAFASEVLEHVQDDVDVLRRVRACMRSGGVLLATSPSEDAPLHRLHQRIYGRDPMDEARGHLRRYTPEGFCRAGMLAGFVNASATPIAGVVRDILYGSRLGLRATRFAKRPMTGVIQSFDRASIGIAPSQLLLRAVAP